MFNLAEAQKDTKVRVLGVGKNGSGKTVGFASWPGKHLIFDFSNRWAPLIDWFPERLGDYDIEVIGPKDFWSKFHRRVNELADSNPYDNIHIADITSLSNTTVMMQLITKGGLEVTDKMMAEFAKDKNKKDGLKYVKGGVQIPGWDEINGELMLIGGCLEALKSFKCNLFVHAHPLDRMADGKKFESIVTFGPKLESAIPGYFDEIWHFSLKAPMQGDRFERVIHTRPSVDYPGAKTAIKDIPSSINFTDKRLYDVVKEYL